MDVKEHWEQVYRARPSNEMSWFEASADVSLKLMRACQPSPDTPLIDVGAGASVLVDQLLAEGLRNITLLDVSGAALAKTRDRLGTDAKRVRWIENDILEQDFDSESFAIWHDRAVFHFLTDEARRHAYTKAASRSIMPGGHLIIATFAEDGPQRCSGLDVRRYSLHELQTDFGDTFDLIESLKITHTTPTGKPQQFNYLLLQKKRTFKPQG